MKKFLIRFLAIIGSLTILFFITTIIAGIFIWKNKKGHVPGKAVLELDFKKELVEYMPDDPAAIIMNEPHPTVLDIVESLKKASGDKRVAGLICRIGGARIGFAQIQEIRDAVLAFRKKGKPAVVYTDTFGEFSAANGAYYLATAFDKIYLQPSGDIGLTGLFFETAFVKGTLEKLEVVPRMDHRHEYKNFMNTFTEKKYTEPHKEALEKIMESLFAQIVRDIAKARNLSEEELRTAINQGPFLGKEASDAKLVDVLAYRDEVYEKIKQQAGTDELLTVSAYLKRSGKYYTKGDSIALIYGVGAIQRGESEYDPMSGDIIMGSESVATAFRSAIADKDVKAILFRIDSPGGSYVASDSVWREVVRARQSGKPVIVSMGNVAASGGYFVAMAADKIVAQPGTITGSIGVFAGKMLTSGFWDKIGISWDEIHTSENASIWTGTHDYTPEQWQRLQDALDRIYEDFTTKVAAGRNLPKDKVLEIAKGRIWSGEDAKELGLVDELGGIPTAILLAKKAANIPEDEKICLKRFPPKKPLLDIILEKSAESTETKASVATARMLKKIQPAVRFLKQVGIAGDSMTNHPGVLSMPEIETIP